jgi:hypothetical protein
VTLIAHRVNGRSESKLEHQAAGNPGSVRFTVSLRLNVQAVRDRSQFYVLTGGLLREGVYLAKSNSLEHMSRNITVLRAPKRVSVSITSRVESAVSPAFAVSFILVSKVAK